MHECPSTRGTRCPTWLNPTYGVQHSAMQSNPIQCGVLWCLCNTRRNYIRGFFPSCLRFYSQALQLKLLVIKYAQSICDLWSAPLFFCSETNLFTSFQPSQSNHYISTTTTTTKTTTATNNAKWAGVDAAAAALVTAALHASVRAVLYVLPMF